MNVSSMVIDEITEMIISFKKWEKMRIGISRDAEIKVSLNRKRVLILNSY